MHQDDDTMTAIASIANRSAATEHSDITMSRIVIDPEQILSELREFCGQYFESQRQKKKELRQKLYSYLGKIIPEMCDRLNAQILNKEQNIVYINSLCYVFGDIHGNVEDIYDYEKLFWDSNDTDANYLFIGDYVDRGDYGVEVCVYLFALKMLSPKQFTLVRGNHEVREIQKTYTFYNECISKFGKELGKVIWDQINTCFERLPLAAIIDKRVFCCHGGVPKGEITIKDIMNIQKPLVDPSKQSQVAEHILWNDPIESMTTFNTEREKNIRSEKVEFLSNRTRGIGCYFTAMAAKQFLDRNDLHYLIRCHEAETKGYKFTSDDRVITVFSSSNYGGKKNTTACARVSSKLIQIILLKQPSSKSTDSKSNKPSNK